MHLCVIKMEKMIVGKLFRVAFLVAIVSVPGVSSNTWFRHDNKELLVPTSLSDRTWHEAREYCMTQGGDLATLSDADTTTVLMEKANATSTYSNFWIGYNKIMKDSFSWSNGDQGIEETWASGYPIDDPDFACAYVVRNSQGQMYNTRCSVWNKHGFFCQRGLNYTIPNTDPPTPQVPGFCPRGYFNVDNGNKCYKVHIPDDTNPGWTWHEALDLCEKGPGHMPTLGTIQSEKETWAVMAGMQDKRAELWLGLRREYKNERFRWINNDIMTSYAPWNSMGANDDSCGFMLGTEAPAKWNGGHCNIRRGFLCQTFKDPDTIISTTPQGQINCPSGYSPYWYGCYRYSNITATWEQALEKCQLEGSTLLSIHYEAEMAAVQAFRDILEENDENPPLIWLGLHYDAQHEAVAWTDNWPLIFDNWGSFEPNFQQGHCVNMNQNGQWFMKDCREKQQYICKYTTVPPLTTPKHTEGECPPHYDNENWLQHGSYCYYVQTSFVGEKNYADAQGECMARGGVLASIHHPYLNNMLLNEASKNCWIGLHRGKTGSFQWIDNSPVEYVKWQTGGKHEDDCVALLGGSYENGDWIVEDCEVTGGYICQFEKVLPATPPEPNNTRCPDDEWENWGDFCYLFKPNEFASLETAEQTCATRGGNQGGYLASIHDAPENRHVTGRLHQLSTLPFHRTFWIGLLKNATTNKWYWYDNTDLIYQNWYSQSSGPYAAECVELDSSSGLWYHQNCDEPLGFVCKAHKAPVKDEEDKNDNEKEEPSSGLSGGEMAGVVIGALVIIGLFVVVNVILIMRFRKQVATSSDLSRRTSVSSGVSNYSNTSGTSKSTITA